MSHLADHAEQIDVVIAWLGRVLRPHDRLRVLDDARGLRGGSDPASISGDAWRSLVGIWSRHHPRYGPTDDQGMWPLLGTVKANGRGAQRGLRQTAVARGLEAIPREEPVTAAHAENFTKTWVDDVGLSAGALGGASRLRAIRRESRERSGPQLRGHPVS